MTPNVLTETRVSLNNTQRKLISEIQSSDSAGF